VDGFGFGQFGFAVEGWVYTTNPDERQTFAQEMEGGRPGAVPPGRLGSRATPYRPVENLRPPPLFTT